MGLDKFPFCERCSKKKVCVHVFAWSHVWSIIYLRANEQPWVKSDGDVGDDCTVLSWIHMLKMMILTGWPTQAEAKNASSLQTCKNKEISLERTQKPTMIQWKAQTQIYCGGTARSCSSSTSCSGSPFCTSSNSAAWLLEVLPARTGWGWVWPLDKLSCRCSCNDILTRHWNLWTLRPTGAPAAMCSDSKVVVGPERHDKSLNTFAVGCKVLKSFHFCQSFQILLLPLTITLLRRTTGGVWVSRSSFAQRQKWILMQAMELKLLFDCGLRLQVHDVWWDSCARLFNTHTFHRFPFLWSRNVPHPRGHVYVKKEAFVQEKQLKGFVIP